MMNKKTEQRRNAYVGQPLEKEKRALLCNNARFLAALGEESVSGLGVSAAGRSTSA